MNFPSVMNGYPTNRMYVKLTRFLLSVFVENGLLYEERFGAGEIQVLKNRSR